jgi:hypothetical protein
MTPEYPEKTTDLPHVVYVNAIWSPYEINGITTTIENEQS